MWHERCIPLLMSHCITNHILRLNRLGGKRMQLETNATCTFNQKWVYFTNLSYGALLSIPSGISYTEMHDYFL